MINIIKNPVIIGLFGSGLTYIYLLWSNKQNSDDKNKQYSQTKIIMLTFVIGIICWLISLLYFRNINILDNNKNDNIKNSIDLIYSSSEPNKSFHLIGKGLNIPKNLPNISDLPDVFIETI